MWVWILSRPLDGGGVLILVVVMKVTRSVQSPEKRSRDAERHAAREKESGGSLGKKKKRPPLLIKHLGAVDQKKGQSQSLSGTNARRLKR